MTAAEILRKAKAKIECDGWAQGRYGTIAGLPSCAVGAMMWAAEGSGGPRGGSYLDAEMCLREASGDNHITSWNDDRRRTKAEVLDTFTRAIALAEAPSPTTAPRGEG